MPIAPVSTEITMLGCAVSLMLLQIALQAGMGSLSVSVGYLLGPRDTPADIGNVYAKRAGRALANALETFPLFAAVALALAVTGRTGGNAALGAQIYVWARLAYVPLYLFGIPVARTLAWVASMAGIVMMLLQLFKG